MDAFPALPTDEAMADYDQQRLVNGFMFPLRVTSAGMGKLLHARVRRLNTVDRAAMELLPDHLQKVVTEGLKELKAAQASMTGDEDPDTMDEILANNSKILKAATMWCTAAFINPSLHENEIKRRDAQERETDSGIRHWHVDRVAPEDRIAVFVMCVDSDSPHIDKLKLFRPKWSDDVQDGEAGEADRIAPVRDLEAVPEGV